MQDPHAAARRALEDAVLRGPGETPPALRLAVAHAAEPPAALAALVDKIRRTPYAVTDDDVAALRGAFSEDALFELIVATALGASTTRLELGLRALEAAADQAAR